MVLDNEFDPTCVDWENPGANYLFEHFRARFKQWTEENRQLKENLKRRDEKIMQLEAELKKMSGHTHVSRPEKKARHGTKYTTSYRL